MLSSHHSPSQLAACLLTVAVTLGLGAPLLANPDASSPEAQSTQVTSSRTPPTTATVDAASGSVDINTNISTPVAAPAPQYTSPPNASATVTTTPAVTSAPASAVQPPAPTPAVAPTWPQPPSLGYHNDLLLAPPAHGWIFDGDLDVRYRSATSGRSNSVYLNEGELDIGHPIFTDNQYQGNVFAQIVAENVPDRSGGQGKYDDVSLGEAYLTYHLPFQTETGSSAYLQIGQFPLPVGLLPVYDTHLYILQTLAPLAIGERLDYGAEVEGRFNGVIDYRFAVTTGEGVDHVYLVPNRVVSFRMGRLFATTYGTVNFGGSLLSGRLPVTEVDPTTGFAPIIPPSGKINPLYGYVNKTRLAGDGTWTYRALTARGEAMTGADGGTTVDGYFGMAEYRFAQGLSATLSRTYWYYGQDSSTSTDNAIGMDFTYSNNAVLRFLYEERRDVPYVLSPTTGPIVSTHLRYIFTVQTLLRF